MQNYKYFFMYAECFKRVFKLQQVKLDPASMCMWAPSGFISG